MFDEEPPVPEEVLISAKDQLNEEEIRWRTTRRFSTL